MLRLRSMPRLARLLPALASAAAMLAAPAVASAADYVPGEVVVRLHDDADKRDLKAVKRSTGIGRARTFAPRTKVLKIRDGESVDDTVLELRARPEVD